MDAVQRQAVSTACYKSKQLLLFAFVRHIKCTLNPLAAKLFNLNFHPLEVVSR